MKELTAGERIIRLIGDEKAVNVLIQPVDDGDGERLQDIYDNIIRLTDHPFLLVGVPVSDWNSELAPWKAPAVFGPQGFEGGAEKTLEYILKEVLSLFEGPRQFFLGGYSLAGLFALWCGYNCDAFTGIAGVSPSVWFEGWKEYISEHEMRCDRIYLSLGDREARTRNQTMARVAGNIEYMHELLKKEHDCVLQWNPGNHFMDSALRCARGWSWLLNRQ